MKYCVLIPAYNEEKTIFQTVTSVKKFADVIVVNDCSIDQTTHNAQKAGAIVITPNTNKGYDGALEFGFKFAIENKYTHLVTFDADGQHPAESVPLYFSELQSSDLILGIRPKYARFSEFIFACYSLLFYGVRDPLCGMKGYNLSLLIGKEPIITYQSIGTELMFYFLGKKAKFKQIKININDRHDQSRFGSHFSVNKKIINALLYQIVNSNLK